MPFITILTQLLSRQILQRLIIGLMVIFSIPAMALDPLLSLRIGEAENKLKVIEKSLETPESIIEPKVLSEFHAQGLFVRKSANECINVNELSINRSADDLELLGAQVLTEESQVTDKRQSLNKSMMGDAQQLASCRLLLLRVHQVLDVIVKRQQQVLTHELLLKTDNLLINIKNNLLNPLQIYTALVDFIEQDSGVSTLSEDILYLLLMLVAVNVLIYVIKRQLKSSLLRYSESEHQGYLSQFQISLISCCNRHISALLITGSLSLFYGYQILILARIDFISLLVLGLFLYVILNLFIRILLNPCQPGQKLTSLPEGISLMLANRLRVLSKLLLIGFLMYSALQIHEFPSQVTALLRNVYVFLLVLNLIWAVWLLRFYQGLSNIHLLRLIIIVGLVTGLLADWAGYINLADFILLGITISMMLWALVVFVLRVFSDFMDSMDEGRNEWQKSFRKRIGLRGSEFIPGSIWFRFTLVIVTWSSFMIVMLKVWGFPDSLLISVKESVVAGFEIGSVMIEPLKVIFGLLTFAAMLSIIGWFKRRMEKSWLKRSRMDKASKESMISLTGYLGVAIAFLIGLSIAGVQLANVALIVGALSVGIGFGLQNIFNNFISGVILLFERPIKTGDWIVVGGTEGYVKKISIRSTQIQTFDRSDVIVPNSELISSQVTNWMFRDKIGRVIVPIGVAYGTDSKLVKDILLQIAFDHPSVITKSPIISKPWVLFRTFGDSSLNFELRCYIKAADDRLKVISDMNFSIEAAFRSAGIEIPFPQRDVHLVSDSDTRKDHKVITTEE